MFQPSADNPTLHVLGGQVDERAVGSLLGLLAMRCIAVIRIRQDWLLQLLLGFLDRLAPARARPRPRGGPPRAAALDPPGVRIWETPSSRLRTLFDRARIASRAWAAAAFSRLSRSCAAQLVVEAPATPHARGSRGAHVRLDLAAVLGSSSARRSWISPSAFCFEFLGPDRGLAARHLDQLGRASWAIRRVWRVSIHTMKNPVAPSPRATPRPATSQRCRSRPRRSGRRIRQLERESVTRGRQRANRARKAQATGPGAPAQAGLA